MQHCVPGDLEGCSVGDRYRRVPQDSLCKRFMQSCVSCRCRALLVAWLWNWRSPSTKCASGAICRSFVLYVGNKHGTSHTVGKPNFDRKVTAYVSWSHWFWCPHKMLVETTWLGPLGWSSYLLTLRIFQALKILLDGQAVHMSQHGRRALRKRRGNHWEIRMT